MKIHEYQAKELMAQWGIPVPAGKVAFSPEEARAVAKELGLPVALKSQVHVGGRGKAGGIKIARDEASLEAGLSIFGMDIKGFKVERVLVEKAGAFDREMYLGFTVDREAKRVALMFSFEGGVEIEEVAKANPAAILKIVLDPLIGLLDHHLFAHLKGGGLPTAACRRICDLARRLYRMLTSLDLSLVEINPLVMADAEHPLALDGKINLDENALFRLQQLESLRDENQEDPMERKARLKDLNYVKLDGSIGVIGNGAGLVMATLDVVADAGGAAANFLDIGGGANAEKVASALELILEDGDVRGVLINIFGGITRCDAVARGVLGGIAKVRPACPIVIRLAGTNEAEGRAILSAAGFKVETTMQEAARRIVAEVTAAKGGDRA